MTVTLTRDGDRLAVAFPYDPGLVAAVKAVPGRRWDPGRKVWTVPIGSPELQAFVERTSAIGDADVLAEVAGAAQARLDSAEASRATSADIDIPVPAGLALLPYQRAGVAYALARRDTLLADEMGLGKTVQAVALANAAGLDRVAVICPASLKVNWSREWARWSTRPAPIHVGNGTPTPWDILFPLGPGVLIVNYDILNKWRPVLMDARLDLLVLDEAHYLKTPKAQRTVNVLGKWDRSPAKVVEPIPAKHRLALTGTPLLNRPIEAWGICHAFAPDTFRSWRTYATRYCAGYQSQWGWDVSGSSNLDELQRLLRETIMVRRLKADVLTELPPKRRAVVPLPTNGAQAVVDAERSGYDAHQARLAHLRLAVEQAEASEDPEAYAQAMLALRKGAQEAFEAISELRHLVALAKVPAVIDVLKDATEQGKVICFAHHRDVVAAIAGAFGSQAVVITGDTPQANRQVAVDRFQNDPDIRLFVGNMRAAGVGLTLTASSHVVFAELDWTPSNVTQAEDRAHRIGQTDSVLVQHLVLEGSLDATMARMLVEKQDVIDRALDVDPGAHVVDTEPIIVTERPERPARDTEPVTEGWYSLDGDVIKVQRALYGSGRLYAKRLVKDAGEWTWRYEHDLVNRLDNAKRLTLEEAARFGRLYGICAICGRPLTDETSIERGIGPVCARGFA